MDEKPVINNNRLNNNRFKIIKLSNNRRSVLRDIAKYMSDDTKLTNVAARCHIFNKNFQINFKFKCQRSQKVTKIKHWLHNYEKYKENVLASQSGFSFLCKILK